MLSSLCWPSKEADGYMFVPIPSLRPVSFAMASWSPSNWSNSTIVQVSITEERKNMYCIGRKNLLLPVIILTLTPRLRAWRMVSALSCLGGSKRGNKPTNCHGLPGLSLVFSGTTCQKIKVKKKKNQRRNNKSFILFFLYINIINEQIQNSISH